MKYFLAFLCFSFSAAVFAQQHAYLHQTIEAPERIVPARYGDFYTVSWQPNCPDDYIVVRYMDVTGAEKKRFTSPIYIASVSAIQACVNDKNHLVLYLRLGDIDHSLYEFDSLGNTLWNQNYQFVSKQVKFNQILNAASGYYLLGSTYKAGVTDSDQAFIFKIDKLGKQVWNKMYSYNPAIASHTFFNKALVNNDTLVIAGHFYPDNYLGGQQPWRPFISKLDSSGNFIWGQYYMIDSGFMGFDEYAFVDLQRTASGMYYALGFNYGNEHALFKMDAQGNLVRIKEKLSGKLVDMSVGYNENLFIVPEYAYYNGVYEMDSSLNVIAGHAMRHNNTLGTQYDKLQHIVRHNCGFLFSDNYGLYGHADDRFTYCNDSLVNDNPVYYSVTKFYTNPIQLFSYAYGAYNDYMMNQPYTALMPNSTQVCSVGKSCTANATELTNMRNEVWATVFPNPVADYLHLQMEYNKKVELRLYNRHGQLLKQFSQFSTADLLDVRDLSSGLYFLKVSDGKHSTSLKFSVEH